MCSNRYPVLYQMNTRVRLTGLRGERPATLDDLPDSDLDRLADLGVDWLWLLGVWQTGRAGRRVSRSKPEWVEEYARTLPDLTEADICGSCFSIRGYSVHEQLGGEEALVRLRSRARERGIRLMLDFVPNHMALDHPWLLKHPGYFVRGTDEDLVHRPKDFIQLEAGDGRGVFAYGRDPYFDGWPDTLQLNYGEPELQAAMLDELLGVAELCDGVRCDMAMLIEPEVFERTWGILPVPFWPEAIRRVKEIHPGFLFMAEVYWNMEWTLQQHGFDYTYDKRLYDRLREGHARSVREHLHAELQYQNRLARFLENHDEPRAAATFSPDVHRAAAIVTYLAPGFRFMHHGQVEGWKKRISPHLCRGPDEVEDAGLSEFYLRLLECLKHPSLREGGWQQLQCVSAGDGNESWDSFLAYSWDRAGADRILVVVNYAPGQRQCRVRLPFEGLRGATHRLRDLMGPSWYDRDGEELVDQGLYVDMPGWGYHVFCFEPAK